MEETKDKASEEVKEDSIDESKEEEEEILPRRRGRSQRSPGVPSWKKEKRKEKSPKRDLNSESPKPKQREKSPEKNTEETDAPKKRRGRPKRQPEPSTSEDSSQEKEKPTTPVVKTPKLLKQKGVSINKAGQVMIPSHKIASPEELCLIVENKKGKKIYQCQICSKEFNRKDIINYHAYNEHREELLEYGKGLPEELTRDTDSSPPRTKSNNAASAVFSRIFKSKMMSGNKDSVRKGQVEIQVKSKNDDDDDRRILKTKLVEDELASKSRKDQADVQAKSKSSKDDDTKSKFSKGDDDTEKEDDQRKFKTKLIEDEKINKSRKDQAESPSKSKDMKDIDEEEEVVGRKKVKNKPSEDEKMSRSKSPIEIQIRSKSVKSGDENKKVLKRLEDEKI